MFHLVFALPWFIVATRFMPSLPWDTSLKVVVTLLLLVGSQYHLVSRLSSGSVFAPEFPRPLVIAFNLVFGALVLLALLQIGLDAVSLVMAVVHGGFWVQPAAVRYVMAGIAFGLSAYGVWQAIRVPPVRDIEVGIAGLDPIFDGYRLVQLTDLHISRLFPASWAKAVVERANDLDADLIVMTGDLIDGSVAHRQGDVEVVAQLRARDGVLAVPGNHEYFFDYDAWMREYRRLNMRVLLNNHAVIRRGKAAIVVAGVTDRSAARFGKSVPNLAQALAGAPRAAPVILLDCPSSNDLRLFDLWKNRVSGSVCGLI